MNYIIPRQLQFTTKKGNFVASLGVVLCHCFYLPCQMFNCDLSVMLI